MTGSYVTLNTAQTITGVKAFSQTGGNPNLIEIVSPARIQFGGFATTTIHSTGGKNLSILSTATDGANTIGITAGVSGSSSGGANTLTLQALGNQSGTEILLSAPRTRIIGDTTITGSLTHSLQQGSVLVGGANGITQAVPTSSFGGGGTINTGSFATTGSNTFVGNQVVSGSLTLTSQGGDVKPGLVLKSGSTDFLFGLRDDGRLQLSSSNQTPIFNIDPNSGWVEWNANVTNFNSGVSFRANATFRNILTDPVGGPYSAQFDNVIIENDLIITGSLTSSLQQGYVWVGNSLGKTTTVPTSSFGGGGSGNGFPFSGSAEITGSLSVSETVETQILLTPQVLTGPLNVPSGYNGMLTGPVSNSGIITISSGSTLVII